MSKKNKDFGIEKVLKNLGIKAENKGTSTGGKWFATGKVIESYSPVDGNLIAKVTASSKKDYEKVIAEAEKAFKEFRLMPAPKRGEIVRQFGDKLRKHKEDLGKLVSYEMGKSLQEGISSVTWFNHAFRTSRSQNVRTVSSTRNCRNYFCIQFSSGGLVLEHSVSLDLWRCLRLETFRKNTIVRNCLSKHHHRSASRE